VTDHSLKGVKVFVTGINGFIGSHLGARLLKEGARIFGLVRRGSDLWRIAGIDEEIALVTGDLRDRDGLRRALREIKPEVVFHLAGLVDVSRSFDLVDGMVEINVHGTMAVVRALKNLEFRCFINTGASEEYGNGPVPFREDQIPAPVSPYSAAKACTTTICQMLYRGLGLPLLTLRPFNTYGPKQTNDMFIPYSIRKALAGEPIKMTKGEQTRDFVFVEDVVEAFVLAAQEKEAVGEVINLGSGLEHRIRDVVEMIMKMTRSKSRVEFGALPYRPGESMRFYSDSSKAQRLLGWVPKVSLEEGLRKTIDWYREELDKGSREKTARHGR